MTAIARRRPARVPLPVFVSDFGSDAIPREIEDVAVGTRATIKRAKRADPLLRLPDVTLGMRYAAQAWIQATEHAADGKGLGPMPWGADGQKNGHSDGVRLLAQERAIGSAAFARRGTQAMGMVGREIVWAYCVEGKALRAIDLRFRWRQGLARVQLVAALGRLAEEYGCA